VLCWNGPPKLQGRRTSASKRGRPRQEPRLIGACCRGASCGLKSAPVASRFIASAKTKSPALRYRTFAGWFATAFVAAAARGMASPAARSTCAAALASASTRRTAAASVAPAATRLAATCCKLAVQPSRAAAITAALATSRSAAPAFAAASARYVLQPIDLCRRDQPQLVPAIHTVLWPGLRTGPLGTTADRVAAASGDPRRT
jgi:hypothetical protein